MQNLRHIWVWVLAVSVAFPARAANPESATYSLDSSRIFWIMHISDTHIGTDVYPEDTRMIWALEEAYAVIDPEVIIVTGDLCDGSRNGIPASGQEQAEWDLYRQIVDDAGMTVDIYIDIPGNHDGYGDAGLTFYLANSLNGETFNKTTRSMLLTFPFGQYFLYGTATNGEDGAIFIDNNEFSQAELDEMDAELTANDGADLIFMFGHHPIQSPANAAQAIQIMQTRKGIYFHGHLHAYGSKLQDGILVAQVNSLGKSDTNNLAVIAVDNNAVSYAATSSNDPWPMIVVTAPADRKLDSGEDHPYAYEVPTNCTDNPVRALVFDTSIISAVTFEAAGGQATPMNPHPTIEHLWEGVWDTTGIAPGETTLTVTAHASQVRSRQVTVMMSDLSCLPPVQNPDGGVPTDDGGADADGSVSDPDGGDTQMDAATTPDASGTVGGASDGGCNCRALPGGTAPAFPLFAVLALLFIFVEFKRRKRNTR